MLNIYKKLINIIKIMFKLIFKCKEFMLFCRVKEKIINDICFYWKVYICIYENGILNIEYKLFLFEGDG